MSDETNELEQDQQQPMTDQQVEELVGPATSQAQPGGVAPAQAPPPVARPMVQPPQFRPGQIGPVITKKLTPRADGMGYDETTRIESRQPYSGIDGQTAALIAGQPAPMQPQPQPQTQTQAQALVDERIFGGNVAKRELSAAKFFEECYQRKECARWKVEVRRQRPVKWPNNKFGKPLRQGDLGTVMLDTFSSLRDRIIEQFGGGRYLLLLKDDKGSDPHERMFLDISTQEYPPRNPEALVEDEAPDEDGNGQSSKTHVAEEPAKEDRIAEIRRKRQEKLEEHELKKV
jgi:hypothetical protein